MTFTEPGAHGPAGTGTQGIGVGTPRAAAVAAMTAGFAGEAHIPNIGMFAIGNVSAIVATNWPPAVTGAPLGTTVSGTGGPRPMVHDSIAELTTRGGIVRLSRTATSVRALGGPGAARQMESRTTTGARSGRLHGPVGPSQAPPDRTGGAAQRSVGGRSVLGGQMNVG